MRTLLRRQQLCAVQNKTPEIGSIVFMSKRKINDGFEVAKLRAAVIALPIEQFCEDTALLRLLINGDYKLDLAPCPTQS